MDFSDLGKHCEYCKRHDYLPIKCNLCQKYYCKEHSSLEKHMCSKYKINNKNKNKKKTASIYTESCTFANCKKKEMIRFECKLCNKNFCINHRLPEGHNCFKVTVPKVINNKKENKVIKTSNKKHECLNCVIL